MKRIYQKTLFELLEFFPCVAVVGVRQCGKTTLMQQLPAEWQLFDLEKASDFVTTQPRPNFFILLALLILPATQPANLTTHSRHPSIILCCTKSN